MPNPASESQIIPEEKVSPRGPEGIARHCYLILSPDGNRWRVQFGESRQQGIGGFGDTPTAAVEDFERKFRIEPRPHRQGWVAWVDDGGNRGLGSGPTEAEAIRDLLAKIEGARGSAIGKS